MKPVMQDRFGNEGNCVAACYATLLGVPLADIPDLCVDRQWDAECAFLQSIGLGLIRVHQQKIRGEYPAVDQCCRGVMLSDGLPFMLSGKGPRGFGHRVIARDTPTGPQIIHDPHPEGGGLLDVWAAQFIINPGVAL